MENQVAPVVHIGKVRSWVLDIVLGILTLGIYFIYWQVVSFMDLKKFRGRGMGGLGGFILAFFVVNIFLLPSEIEQAQRKIDIQPTVSALTGFWVLIPVIGGIVWLYKTQDALNLIWETASEQVAAENDAVDQSEPTPA